MLKVVIVIGLIFLVLSLFLIYRFFPRFRIGDRVIVSSKAPTTDPWGWEVEYSKGPGTIVPGSAEWLVLGPRYVCVMWDEKPEEETFFHVAFLEHYLEE